MRSVLQIDCSIPPSGKLFVIGEEPTPEPLVNETLPLYNPDCDNSSEPTHADPRRGRPGPADGDCKHRRNVEELIQTADVQLGKLVPDSSD